MFNFRTTITVTNSWGEVINGRWNGLVETLLTGKTDLTAIAAMRAERLKVVDYCSVASYEFYPGFIFRHPRSGISNVFFKPFDTYVWFSCVAISLAITMTFYAIVRSENNIISSNINSLTTAVLISIGATCQQGSSEQPKKFSGRLIFVMMFLFSTILYQFYSSSIVASLLVTPVKSINTIEKLANSGLDAGVEDMANLRALIEKAAANNTMVQKIINEKIHRPGRAPEYVLPAEGVRKMQKERYAFFTDPASTYWLINSLFTEEEKCDLTEIATAREIGSQMLRKRSPYKKLFSYGNVVLLETGIIHRETQKWRAKRPKCNDGKSQTDQTAGADVSLHDVLPVLTLLFCGIVLAIVIFIIEIIVHRFKTLFSSNCLALTDFNTQYELIEEFLIKKSLNTAVFFTCWTESNRLQVMNNLNRLHYVAISFHAPADLVNFSYEERDNLNNVLSISISSPILGVVIDWNCLKNASFEFVERHYWNSSYHWLMLMDLNANDGIEYFLSHHNISLTVYSEVILAYPIERTFDKDGYKWRLYDIYRTAYEPRGQLVIDELNRIAGKWGRRSWKYDKRSDLKNLTLNAITLVNTNATLVQPSKEELIYFLTTYSTDRSYSVQRFSYAIMYPLTRNLLNMTMNLIHTDKWGYMVDGKWDGLVGALLSGEADFSVCLNAIRTERLDVTDYSSVSTWKHDPCFIFRHPRSTDNINIFVRPFERQVWFCIIGIMIISAGVYYIINRFQSDDSEVTLKIWSDIVLLKVATLCQQGLVVESPKLSNRLIILLMFIFSMVIYQFYSSSIVSGLLRPTTKNIDTVKKLEESGMDFGIENWSILKILMNVKSEKNPYLKKIVDTKINPTNEYITPKAGVEKLKKGNYAFFTDPAVSYFFINDIFTEKEKCDLSELFISRPEVTGFLIQKRSPYKKLISHSHSVLLETGLVDRELKNWHAKKPHCVKGKRITEESLVSVEFKDITSILAFLLFGVIVSLIIFTLEIIVHHLKTKNKKHVNYY
ncbi:uncharacterized protein LOC126840772 [Adelges cooleyi]|uniref:uncharacterized protein LOC126840772 n=1 Tax=Adelges cooleyi TaxID=133065 RepID=UPI00218005B6|nr:uncharacterized protein LOC126840772 [Adelges cooleyi]